MSLSRYLLRLLVLYAFLHVCPVFAGMDVRVVGLIADRAVLLIEGQQCLLSVGQTSPEGVTLVSASSEAAVLLINGEETTARLDGRVSTRKRSAEVKEVQVWRNTAGMYTTVGSINGLHVSLLVDTGATQVAMNASQARRLGIDFHVIGQPASVTTASGVAPAWMVTLDSVKVGDLEVRNVPAVVIDGAQPAVTLLGMSYLERLEIVNEGRLMTLRKRY
jgi:aspartyl protease family protein